MITSPSDAELDASMDLLTFVWSAAGNDPRVVTPELALLVRGQLAQSIWQLPVLLQALFANARANLDTLQTQWNAATPDRRVGMAAEFQQLLGVLGLGGAGGTPSNAPNSYNAHIASNIAWNASGAGDWSAR